MMGQKTMMVKRTLLLLSVVVATLIAASGVAFAVSKVCPSGSTEANPCSGTTGIDTLIGTSGPDYIKGLAGNDKISGGAGNDTTDGGGGNDTYSYKDGWGHDLLRDTGGSADHLNFSAVGSSGGDGVTAYLLGNSTDNDLFGPDGEELTLPSGTFIEKVTGSSGEDYIDTGPGANTLRPGPGTGGAYFVDEGGMPNEFPASSDTYSGFSASGYGEVSIEDHGGTADKLVLPFASTDAYFEAYNPDGGPAADDLLIMTSSTDSIYIYGQLEPNGTQKGHIEQIQFTDEILTIGSETAQEQTLSGAKTTDSAEARVAELNEASSLDAAEKEKRKEAAKKIIEEAKKKAQDLDKKHSPSGAEKKR
jgi:Ca2+-binding RTX toxin-like protein